MLSQDAVLLSEPSLKLASTFFKVGKKEKLKTNVYQKVASQLNYGGFNVRKVTQLLKRMKLSLAHCARRVDKIY